MRFGVVAKWRKRLNASFLNGMMNLISTLDQWQDHHEVMGILELDTLVLNVERKDTGVVSWISYTQKSVVIC